MLARAGQHGITIMDSPACLADLQILKVRALASSGAGAVEVARTVTRAENVRFGTSCRRYCRIVGNTTPDEQLDPAEWPSIP